MGQEQMKYQELQLIDAQKFRECFAPKLSIATVRNLFHSEGFPAVQIGTRLYTTEKAAAAYLSNLGGDGLND